MRRAMDLVHFVVKDGVIPDLAAMAASSSSTGGRRKGARRGSWRLEEFDRCATVHNAVKKFEVGACLASPYEGFVLGCSHAAREKLKRVLRWGLGTACFPHSAQGGLGAPVYVLTQCNIFYCGTEYSSDTSDKASVVVKLATDAWRAFLLSYETYPG